MNRRGAKFSFSGALIFFLSNAVTVTVVMLVYGWVAEKTENDLPTVAIVLLLVTLFLSLVWTLIDLIRRRVMIDRPVEQILEATEKIAAGDFSVRLRVKHSYTEYDYYDCIMENVNVLAAELGKSEVLKTDFIANVSHELKTPLAVIQNYAAALQSDSLDDETRKKYAQTLLNASRRLTGLVTNILKLNKLENQKIKPEYKSFNLTESLAETVLTFEELIESKSLELDCDLDDVTLYSAPSLLEIVWNNLLSNAIKFTEAGGKIGVSLKKENDKAIVTVSDTGCGISPETGKRIFDKFYQGDTSHASEGNGLGLALVKKVIDILGGEISVTSEKNKGSTFTIQLKGVHYE
ncbi:MAG: HAMP domain-containing histidine kinase [Clostridia bacterium]|nr:HAMP domain-containing histidine kinase [Clostridia bacterium]